MSVIVFENEGEIDPRTIKTFGVSVKETENPIGFFGTGLKYAIAILLRERHEVTIYSGTNRYEFAIKRVNVRGKDFEMIAMNGEELPFTTELGKNWKMWQAFRELYCNCVDERGRSYHSVLPQEPQEGKTKIVVNGEQFESVFFERGKIILDLPPNELVEEAWPGVEIYNRESDALYYRGIRVGNLENNAKYTYNLLIPTRLTEDRTLMNQHAAINDISKAVKNLTDKTVIRDILTVGKGYFENLLNYSDLMWENNRTSKEFDEVLAELFHSNTDRLNWSARAFFKVRHNQQAVKNYKRYEMNSVEKKQLDRATGIAEALYKDFADFKIIIVDTLGEQTMALADSNTREIIVSQRCFILGTKYLLSTLIEEYIHLKTGFKDLTREMQTHLFDTISTLIETHVIKEPI